MALETGTYISDLNTSNPAAADGMVDGDNHIRLLKSTIKATFPAITGAVTPTHTELNFVDGVTSAIQTQLDAKQPLDTDLTTLASLTATTDNFVQSKAGVWASRTVAQVKTDLSLTGTNGGDQNLFSTIAVSGQSNIVADATSDTLTIIAGTGVTITTDATTDTLTITGAASVPSGSMMPYAGITEPSGWLFAYGQAVSRATYSSLFTALSTTYGVGDGSTTFNLPDLRGRVVAGQDDMGGTSANRLTGLSGGVDGDPLGSTGGAEAHTLASTELPAHNHPLGFTMQYGSNGGGGSRGSNTFSSDGGFTNTINITTTSNSTGGGDAHNNVQPTIILNYIIKT